MANVLGTLPIVPLCVLAVRWRTGLAFFLGPHFAGDVHLRPGDVAVHVDAAGHHDQATGIDVARGPNGRVRRRGDDLAVGDPQIAHLAVNAVSRIVNGSAGDFQEVGHTAENRMTNDQHQ